MVGKLRKKLLCRRGDDGLTYSRRRKGHDVEVGVKFTYIRFDPNLSLECRCDNSNRSPLLEKLWGGKAIGISLEAVDPIGKTAGFYFWGSSWLKDILEFRCRTLLS